MPKAFKCAVPLLILAVAIVAAALWMRARRPDAPSAAQEPAPSATAEDERAPAMEADQTPTEIAPEGAARELRIETRRLLPLEERDSLDERARSRNRPIPRVSIGAAQSARPQISASRPTRRQGGARERSKRLPLDSGDLTASAQAIREARLRLGAPPGEARAISRGMVQLYRHALATEGAAQAGDGLDQARLVEATGNQIRAALRDMQSDLGHTPEQAAAIDAESERFKHLFNLVDRVAQAETPQQRAESAAQLADWVAAQLPHRALDPTGPALVLPRSDLDHETLLRDRSELARELKRLSQERLQRLTSAARRRES